MPARTALLPVACLLFACYGGTAATEHRPTGIGALQGSGDISPFAGKSVTVTGIVSGDFQDGDSDSSRNLGGFFLQSDRPDDDPATSDGVFVYDAPAKTVDVAPGDKVSVTGTVKEHYGETQLVAESIRIVGTGTVAATDLRLPATVTSNSDGSLIADLEAWEGMLVRFPQSLVVANLRHLERFGEVGLAARPRPQHFTNAFAPDIAGYRAYREALASGTVLLDDGQRRARPQPVPYLATGRDTAVPLRSGNSVTGLTGNLRYSRGSGADGDENWRLMPVDDPEFVADNPRPGALQRSADQYRVASFNVLNFFTGIDRGQPNCGPAAKDRCRGADSAGELSRQLDKIVTALVLLDADIVGLIELENNARESVAILTDALNERLGETQYRYVDTGVIPGNPIKTGFLYKSSRVATKGRYALLDATHDPRYNDERNRPSLAQAFATIPGGDVFTVSVNHLKSKGSPCTAEGDPNRSDGQGNCNKVRTFAAAAIADWLASDPTGSGNWDHLVIGDLNAYTQEDPLVALRDAGLVDLLALGQNGAPRYSFVYDAQIGALDHAFASASLAESVVRAVEWHINADEPPVLDYNLENGRDPALFDAASPYRASDHDPVIVDLQFD